MPNESKNYNSILKGTALFGGVQIFNIAINLIRGKLIAILLGPEGMGISSLLTTASNTIQQFTGLGLNLSSVKEISAAKEKRDNALIQTTIITIRRLLQITALIGCFFSLFCCSLLSEWTFGTSEHKWYFVLLSVVIYLTTLSNGELSILQGLRYIKKLALASIVGSCVGLFIGVPLYYFFHYNGIVPGMIAFSLAIYSFYRYQTYKVTPKNPKEKIQWKKTYPLIRKLISLGIIMMLATLLGTLANYIVNAYIGQKGSLNDVGLFQAANSITNQYIGLVFAAMGMDFFPRLSAISDNNQKIRDLVNQQTEIVILIIIPLAILLIATAPIIIKLLLTDSFLSVAPILRWMGVGIALKAFSFPMGYISFAKGDKKTFFMLEGIWGNVTTLLLNILFYNIWGIYGLGISFVFSYTITNIIYILVTKKLYNFTHNKDIITTCLKTFPFLFITFSISFFYKGIYAHLGMAIIFVIASVICLYELNKKTNILASIKSKIKK